MEKEWTLQTPDGATVYGVTNGSGHAKSAIFMVHCLAGDRNHYAFKRAADYFSPDYDVYRFDLYTWKAGARHLIDCTIQTHADDLNYVMAEYASKYSKVFLIGHSYGGPSVMLANPSHVTAVSLWDPSYDLNKIQESFTKKYVEQQRLYSCDWGICILIGEPMYQEAGQLDAHACAELSKKFKSPIQVIHASEGVYIHDAESYHSHGDKRNIREVVSGTEHNFYEGHSCDDLLQLTAKWFEKF